MRTAASSLGMQDRSRGLRWLGYVAALLALAFFFALQTARERQSAEWGALMEALRRGGDAWFHATCKSVESSTYFQKLGSRDQESLRDVWRDEAPVMYYGVDHDEGQLGLTARRVSHWRLSVPCARVERFGGPRIAIVHLVQDRNWLGSRCSAILAVASSDPPVGAIEALGRTLSEVGVELRVDPVGSGRRDNLARPRSGRAVEAPTWREVVAAGGVE